MIIRERVWLLLRWHQSYPIGTVKILRWLVEWGAASELEIKYRFGFDIPGLYMPYEYMVKFGYLVGMGRDILGTSSKGLALIIKDENKNRFSAY